MNLSLLRLLSRYAVGVSALIFLISFLLIPTARFSQLPQLSFLNRTSGLLSIFSLIGLLLSLGLHSIYHSLTTLDRPKARRELVTNTGLTGKWMYASLFLSFFIFFKAARDITLPMDPDETDYSYAFSKGDTSYFNPLKTYNHTIGNLTSFLSIQAFGLTVVSARLPALAFTLAFLVLLFFFSMRFLNPVIYVLVLLHLFFNEMFIWYMHSFRGYISMILVTFACYYSILNILHRRTSRTAAHEWLFALTFLIAPLTHMMGGVFCALLFISLVAWLACNMRARLSVQKRTAAARLVAIALPLLLVHGVIYVGNFLCLEDFKLVKRGLLPWDIRLGEVLSVFGYFRVWWFKLFVILVLFVIVFKKRSGEKLFADFTLVFLSVSTVFVVGMSEALQAVITDRFLLAFPLVIFAWLGQETLRLQPKVLRPIGLALCFVCVVLAPALESTRSLFHQDRRDFQNFIGNIEERWAEALTSCSQVTSSGNRWDEREKRLVEVFYQKKETRSPSACLTRYRIHFEGFAKENRSSSLAADNAKSLFDDSKGRILFLSE